MVKYAQRAESHGGTKMPRRLSEQTWDDVAARFWSKAVWVGDCLEWQGPLFNGYGIFKAIRKMHRVHRVSWWMVFGVIPPGLCVCHHCDNRQCIRPDHLFLGTRKENMQDAARKGRMQRGEQRKDAKLSPLKVTVIRSLLPKVSQREIARQYGVSHTTVKAIANKWLWAWL